MTVTCIGLPNLRLSTAWGGCDGQQLIQMYQGAGQEYGSFRAHLAGSIPGVMCCGSYQIVGITHFYPAMVEHIMKQSRCSVFHLHVMPHARVLHTDPYDDRDFVKTWVEEQNRKHNGKLVFEYLNYKEGYKYGAVDVFITLDAVDVDYYAKWRTTP